ncbi:MAG: PfkB family carbohydrate kinase [Victivallaceae bacterium]
MKTQRLKTIVSRFADKKIAVVGDLMLDVYVWGKASRISPEAPVPVVQVSRKSCCLGGAANVMRNAVTLGGSVKAFGIIGNDEDGREIKTLFSEYGIIPDTVQVDSSRRTTQKQRVIAGAQQLLRVDYEDTEAVPAECRELIVSQLVKLIDRGEIDAVIFEDYGKGLLEESMLQRIVDAACRKNIITALDPKPGHLMRVKGLTVMKPNRTEAFAMAGVFQKDSGVAVADDHDLKLVAEKLLEEWKPEHLLISLAAQGMALFRKNAEIVIIPTRAREVYDVSGAGDTVIAAFTLAMTAGATPEEAAEIANHAAGIVVGKVGTVTVSADELIKSFDLED